MRERQINCVTWSIVHPMDEPSLPAGVFWDNYSVSCEDEIKSLLKQTFSRHKGTFAFTFPPVPGIEVVPKFSPLLKLGNGEIIGACIGCKSLNLYMGVIPWLAVSESFQGGSIGKSLLNHSLNAYRTSGIYTVHGFVMLPDLPNKYWIIKGMGAEPTAQWLGRLKRQAGRGRIMNETLLGSTLVDKSA